MILGPTTLGLLPPVCAFGSSGFETDLKNIGIFDSGLLAASDASDWPAAFVEPDFFVVAALNAVDWVVDCPLWFACVAALGAVLSAFGFAAMKCFQRIVPGALMELAWETDHGDHVSTSAGTERVSIGNVFEFEGRCGVDLGFKTLVGCWFCSVFGLLSFRSSMFAKAPGWWAFAVAGGAAVALSYLLKMMTQQAAAASCEGRFARV